VASRANQVWLVLTFSLLAFVTLCGLTGFGLSNFLGTVTLSKSARVEAIPPGSVLAVLKHGSVTPEQVSNESLQEGDIVIVSKDGAAFLTLFDGSTIKTTFSTTLVMDTLRVGEFLRRTKDIKVTVQNGFVHVANSDQGDYAVSRYLISTPQGEIDADPGSLIDVNVQTGGDPSTRVIVEAGGALFHSRGKSIRLGAREMAFVSAATEPQGPLNAEIDLVRNGDFSEGPTSNAEEIDNGGLGIAGWTRSRDETAAPILSGSVTITDELGLRVAAIRYDSAANQLARVGMVEQLNEPVEFYQSIQLTATIKLVSQELPVTGSGGEIYPLIIKIVYKDSSGSLHEWRRSFYYNGDDASLADTSRLKVTQGKWESTTEMQQERQQQAAANGRQDLVTVNNDLFVLKSSSYNQDMAAINSVEVYGYGSEYQSWITNIQLLAR
jgi:hypothetical protein